VDHRRPAPAHRAPGPSERSFDPDWRTHRLTTKPFPLRLVGTGDGTSGAEGIRHLLGALMVPHLLKRCGIAGVLGVMATVSVIGIFLTLVALPEPKGQAREEAAGELEGAVIPDPALERAVSLLADSLWLRIVALLAAEPLCPCHLVAETARDRGPSRITSGSSARRDGSNRRHESGSPPPRGARVAGSVGPSSRRGRTRTPRTSAPCRAPP
jgi:hypothetical protein